MPTEAFGHSGDQVKDAELRRRVRELEARCTQLAAQVETKDREVEEARDAQYGAYRQLVELERVRAFDEIVRGIEHSLYNALTPVEGYTELLLMDPGQLADANRAREYLKAILAASKDARSALPRLRELYYSTGAFDFEQHQSVSAVLSKALDEVAQETDVELRTELDTETLSPREWDVLRLLADGLKNREIADLLSVSENTVKTHIRAILSKLSLKNRTQAAAYALLDQHAYEDNRKLA